MSSKAPMTDEALDSVKQLRKEMNTLIKDRCENDLTDDDRNVIAGFERSLRIYIPVFGVVGFGLGIFAAHKSRSRILQAFMAHQRPIHVVFSSGQTAPIPDLTSILKPTKVRDIATYLLCGLGGALLLAPQGPRLATHNLKKSFAEDPERFKGIESWFRKLHADLYRKEADILDAGLEGSILDRLLRMCHERAKSNPSPMFTVQNTAQDKSKQ